MMHLGIGIQEGKFFSHYAWLVKKHFPCKLSKIVVDGGGAVDEVFDYYITYCISANIEGIFLIYFHNKPILPNWSKYFPTGLVCLTRLGGSYAYAFGHIMFVCYIIYNVIYFVGKVVPINLSSLEEVPGCVGGESKRIRRNSHCWGWTTWQYGSQCKVLCIYCILLYCTIYNSFCHCTGMSLTLSL